MNTFYQELENILSNSNDFVQIAIDLSNGISKQRSQNWNVDEKSKFDKRKLLAKIFLDLKLDINTISTTTFGGKDKKELLRIINDSDSTKRLWNTRANKFTLLEILNSLFSELGLSLYRTRGAVGEKLLKFQMINVSGQKPTESVTKNSETSEGSEVKLYSVKEKNKETKDFKAVQDIPKIVINKSKKSKSIVANKNPLQEYKPTIQRIGVKPGELHKKFLFLTKEDSALNRKVVKSYVYEYGKILNDIEYSQLTFVAHDNNTFKVADGQHRLSAVDKHGNREYFFDAVIYPKGTPISYVLENIHKGKKQTVSDFMYMSHLNSPFMTAFFTLPSEEKGDDIHYYFNAGEIKFSDNNIRNSFNFKTLASAAYNLTNYIKRNKNRENLNFYPTCFDKNTALEGWKHTPPKVLLDEYGNKIPDTAFYREVLEWWFPTIKSIPTTIKNSIRYAKNYASNKMFFAACLLYYENFYIQTLKVKGKTTEQLKVEIIERFQNLEAYISLENAKNLPTLEFVNAFLKISNFKLKNPIFTVYGLDGR